MYEFVKFSVSLNLVTLRYGVLADVMMFIIFGLNCIQVRICEATRTPPTDGNNNFDGSCQKV